MSTCATCEHYQLVIKSKDEEIQRLQYVLASTSSASQSEADRDVLLKAQEYSLKIEQLTTTLDFERRDAAQKASEMAAKVKELEKQISTLSQSSGKSSSDLDRVLSQIVYKDNRILELNNTILDKERQILDLQEMCHEQGQVAQAKSQAMQIVQQKIIELESRKTCDVGTETDLSLIPRVQRARSGSPGHAIAQIKFGVRSSPPPLDPSEDMSSFTTEQNGFEDSNDEPGTSKSSRAKKNRKKVTFDLPPSAASSTFNLQNDAATADVMQIVTDLTAENDELRRVISDMENTEIENYKRQISTLQTEVQTAKSDGKNQVLKARAAAQGRIKDLEDRIASMQEEHIDESERLQTRIDTLTDAREWALIERARLQDEVDTYKMKLHDFHEKHAENEQIILELNHRLAQEAQFSERLADDVQEAQFTANQLLEQKQMILDDVERLKEALFAQDELIGVLEADILIYEEHIGILRDSLGATKKENRQIIKSKAFETKIRALEKEKDQMDKRNNDERLRTKALNAKVKTLKKENEELQQKLQETELALESASGSLRPQPHDVERPLALENASDELSIAHEENENVKSKLQETSEQLHIVRCHNFDLQSELSRLQREHQELMQEVDVLRREASNVNNAKVELVASDSDVVENSEHRPEQSILEEQRLQYADQLQSGISSLSDNQPDIDAQFAALSELEEKLIMSTQKIAGLEFYTGTLRDENDQMKRQREFDIRERTEADQQQKESANSLDELQTTVTNLQCENANLREQIVNIEIAAENDKKSDGERITALQKNLEDLQMEKIQLQPARSQAEVTVESMQTASFDQSAITKLEQNIQLLKEENSMLQLQKTDIEEDLKTKITLAEEQAVELESLITQLKYEVSALQDENTVLKESNLQSEEALRRMHIESSEDFARNVARLRSQLESLLSENAALQEERTTDEETLEILRKELVSANNQIENERMKVEMIHAKNCEMENALKMMFSERQASDEQWKSDHAKLISMQEYVAELTARLNESEEAKNHVEELQSDIQNLMMEVVRLREENEELTVRPTRALQEVPADEVISDEAVDTSDLFEGQNGELTRTPSGCLLLENQLLRDCVSETNRMHDDLTSDVNQMMLLNQELENAVGALKGEIWSLNDRLKKCFVEREELLGKIEESQETKRAYHNLQELYNQLVSKKTQEIGTNTDPVESTEDHKKSYEPILVSIEQELKQMRDGDLQTVKEELGQLMTVFCEMRGSTGPLLQKIVEESAAKLTTKQADNDALFRANAELAHTNVALQNQIEELQERLEEAAEANDRFYLDGQQLSEEKIAQFNNMIRSLEDRLELTENLNRELEEKCCEAEQREHIADSRIRDLEEHLEQLQTAGLQDAPTSGGWDEWNSEGSDTEAVQQASVQPAQSPKPQRCQSCAIKDDDIKDLKAVIQEKKQEIAFLKERRCTQCLTKEDELNDISLLLTEANEELSLLKQQLNSERALHAEQLEVLRRQTVEEEERRECQECNEKDLLLAELKETLEKRDTTALVVEEPAPQTTEDCTSTLPSAESQGGWDDWNEDEGDSEPECSVKEQPREVLKQAEAIDELVQSQRETIATLTKLCEEHKLKYEELLQEQEDKSSSKAGRGDWNECATCEEKEQKIQEMTDEISALEGKVSLLNNEVEQLKNAEAENVKQSKEADGWNDWQQDSQERDNEKLQDAQRKLQEIRTEMATLKSASGNELQSVAQLFQKDLQRLSDLHTSKEKSTKKTLLACKKKIASLKKQNELLKDGECRLTDSADSYAREVEKLQEILADLKKQNNENERLCGIEKREKENLMGSVRSLESKIEATNKEISQLKLTISQRDNTIEELKQTLSSSTSNGNSENISQKLSETERQRDEANRKLAELQKKIRSAQQKRRLSTSSRASTATSSHIALNETNEMDPFSALNTLTPRPVVTNNITSCPLPVQDFNEVGVSNESFRRRTAKK